MGRIHFLAAFISVALLTGCVFIGAGPAYLQDNTEADQSAGDGCPDAYTPENLPGCGDMEICCVPSVNPCVSEGDGFESFETDGMCCPGLVPVPDCFEDEGGGCACPNCPCYLCTACGDGACGPFENVCNCPEDCPQMPPPPLDCYPAFPDCTENSYCKLAQGQCYVDQISRVLDPKQAKMP